jgi:transcription-repair coupling factor (superfamily II helicase)
MDQQDQYSEITHATIRSVVEGIADGRTRTEVLGLLGSCGAYLLACELAAVPEPFLVVAADSREAERFAAALAYYHGRPDEILLLPHWEIRPYEPLSPHPEVEAARLAALAALHQGRARAVVTTARALLQRVIPREVLAGLCETLAAGEEYPRARFTDRLLRLGYNAVPLVEDRGTFSVRGDIIDIFPPSLSQPVRLEFFGDTLERLRPFDAASQRSIEGKLNQLQLLPAREMVLAGDYLQRFSLHLKDRCDVLELPRSQREAILEEAREGLLAPGRQFLMPLAYGRLDTLFDYAPQGHWVILDPPAVEQTIDQFAAEVAEGEARMARRAEPYVEAADMYLTPADLERELSLRRIQEFSSLEVFRLQQDRLRYRVNTFGNGDIRSRLSAAVGGLSDFAGQLRQWQEDGWRTLVVCHQQGQAERLLDLLEPEGVRPVFDPGASLKNLRGKDLVVALGELPDGFRLPDERIAVITEEEIFGQRVRRRPRKDVRALLSSLAELKEGDFVVHADQGIGRYHGLQHLSMGPTEGDFLHLEYAGGDKLYLPVERIEKVQKYVGGEGQTPRLDKMGGGAWEKAKLKARAAVEELARDLLKIYARREMSQGFRYGQPDRMFREFEAAFPYEETPDQLRAIQEVLADMESERPVDRLVCGDVGYGKTEVAIRAAFRAALDGRQVAVLVPTTVLARQHWETFRERFKGYPVEIDMVSRFRSTAEQKQVLQRTAAGQVDILIGTHRLLQRDVHFNNLGLVVIDEEQRFGVSHKERLKKLRADVDVITLTATPIPRTLHMSMMGMRDLSVIETPPVDRLAVRTYVTRFDDDLIREAILRELRRGGQVFFVHNRVQSIDAMAEFLRTLVPEARIAVGHGQMGEKALEQVMVDFIDGKDQVLVCSTIIENGIDIPRANTIFINRADCFGLSQLYQLRGRVGRSRHRAYAYLLIPGEGTLTREARERLRVLQDLTELGAGFRVASHDLELRGAGDLLGGRQAGQIAAIGFEMYAELLEETIHELQGLDREEKVDPEVRLGLSAYLPEKYLLDPNQRLVFYKQLAAAEAVDELYDAADELRDRYGELPDPAVLLIEVMKLRVLMKQLRVELVEYTGRQLFFSFHATTPVPPDKILHLIEQPAKYRFSPDYRLSVQIGKMPAEEVLATAKKELQGFF